MAARRAWVLNLDADVELASRSRYAPTKSSRLAMRSHVERLTATLVGPDDLVVDDAFPPRGAQGCEGHSFCPTPRALAILERAGAVPAPHPPVEVLRRVNSRAFASALGATLPGASFVETMEIARRILASDPGIGRAWRVKHAFGMSGRNQRVVRHSASVSAHDLRLIEVWMRAGGGVQIEPDVAIDTEYALHGVLSSEGVLRIGTVVTQRCDERGAWLSTERASTTPRAASAEAGDVGDVVAQLTEEVHEVGRALYRAGYFGPFGVDAYTYRDRSGVLAFQRRSEINARYAMGFAVGFGSAALR